jgi:hypothetical protein
MAMRSTHSLNGSVTPADMGTLLESLESRIVLSGDFVGIGLSTGSDAGQSNAAIVEGELLPRGLVTTFDGPRLQRSNTNPMSFPFQASQLVALDGSSASVFNRDWDERETGWSGQAGDRLGWRLVYDENEGSDDDAPGDGWGYDLWLERPTSASISDAVGDWNVSALIWNPDSLREARAANGQITVTADQVALLSGDSALSALTGSLAALDAQGKLQITNDDGVSWAYLGNSEQVMIGADFAAQDGSIMVFIATRISNGDHNLSGEYTVALGFDAAYASGQRFDGVAAAAGELELDANGSFEYDSEVTDTEIEGSWSYDASSGVLTLAHNGVELRFAYESQTRTLLALTQQIASNEPSAVFGFGVYDISDDDGDDSNDDNNGGDDDDDRNDDNGRRGRGRSGDDFIEQFRMSSPDGLSDDDSDRAVLEALLPGTAYARASWTAENYWFQDSSGAVWSLWHGGEVHRKDDGQHRWVLTNLGDAAGVQSTQGFEPGSMTGLIAPWRAFSIQGVVNGTLVSMWWSPESGRLGWGSNANGWVVTPMDTTVLKDPTTGQPVSTLPMFLPATQTQNNGRLTFDPRATRETREGGMSVVLVSTTGEVYVASFTTVRQADGVPAPELPNQWVIEPIAQVPSLERLGLLDQINDFVTSARTQAGFVG